MLFPLPKNTAEHNGDWNRHCVYHRAGASWSRGFFISLYFVYKKGHGGIHGFRNWFDLFIIGAIFGLHWLTYFLSIKLSSASIGVIGVSTFGIHLLILNWLVKGQRVTLFYRRCPD